MAKKKTTGYEGFNELDKIHAMAQNTHLHVFEGMSAEEIVRVCRVCLASEWDVYPHDLTENQVKMAIVARAVPKWEDGAPQPSKRYALVCKTERLETGDDVLPYVTRLVYEKQKPEAEES